jgi:membrane-bound lytic murein transglycosylase A
MLLRPFLFCFFILSLLLSGCATKAPYSFYLKRTSFESIGLWEDDEQADALIAYKKSCKPLLAVKKGKKLKGALPLQAAHFRPSCEEALSLPAKVSTIEARQFFIDHFTPYIVLNKNKAEGLFTGYYEIDLEGHHKAVGEYQHPLYQMPKSDHLRRVSRREINRGALHGNGLELIYLNDPVDSFFLHIQGSGRVTMPDGKVIRVGYAGQNGHPYVAIGRTLIDAGHLPKDKVTADAIRAWLKKHPRHAINVMESNPSYVYFKPLDGDGPIGAQGVVLTSERSLAIDWRFFAYGLPIWLESTLPGTAKSVDNRYHRLMIAQDTGGAIRGVVRGDVFFGNGARARLLASAMKQKGRYIILVPNSLPSSALAPFVVGSVA